MTAAPSTERTWRVTLNDALCNGCRLCLPGCDVGALLWVRSDAILLVDPWACNGCGSCVARCPEDALTLQRRRP
jgi:MinD superfamily P-loop ATPase